MNNRNGLIAAGVIAVIAVILAVIQSGNLSQSEVKLAAVQTTATAQQAVMTDQWVEAAATLSAASTLAADTQQKAVTNAENAAATAQANSLADAENAAATAQAKALGDAANAASTLQAQALAAASQAASTAQSNALKTAANTAATAQAKSVEEAKNAAATQQAQTVSTLQAGATATLGAVVNAAENAQAEAVATSLSAGATAKAQAVASQQAQATATLGAVIAQAATDQADVQMKYQVTEIAIQTQIAAINDQLATAQAFATNAVNPTAVPTTVATAQATAISPANPTSEATGEVSGVPADWKRYVGKGVAIQLPETYIGTDLGTDPQALGKLLRSLGPDFAPAATLLESNPEILSFIAIHQGNGGDDPAASVIILSIPLATSVPISTLLEATISQLPSGSKVLEKGTVQLGEHEAGRMIVETHVGAIISTQLQYYVIANNTLYLVGFTGTPNQFDAQLPAFEQSMTTFEILAEPGI